MSDTPPADTPADDKDDTPLTSVHTTSLVDILGQMGSTVAVSTYQAGKLIFLRKEGDRTNTHFRNFDTPMGLAYRNGRLVIGTKLHVWEFRDQKAVAERLEPPGVHDGCYMPRRAHVTGNIGIHEMALDAKGEVWAVNTRFSCLCTFELESSFYPRWKPPFVTALASEDRCHLNGLAMRDGQPKYVTALGATDDSAGWRANKARGGVLMDVPSGEIIARGLSMPHSPRWYDNKLWVLESGAGTICTVDPANGQRTVVCELPGFTRGLSFFGPLAFIGLSQVRESAMFSGIPITDRLKVEERMCGMWVVDLRTGQIVAFLRFDSGVQEVFAVEILPGLKYPDLLTDTEKLVDNAFMLPEEVMTQVARTAPKAGE